MTMILQLGRPLEPARAPTHPTRWRAMVLAATAGAGTSSSSSPATQRPPRAPSTWEMCHRVSFQAHASRDFLSGCKTVMSAAFGGVVGWQCLGPEGKRLRYISGS